MKIVRNKCKTGFRPVAYERALVLNGAGSEGLALLIAGSRYKRNPFRKPRSPGSLFCNRSHHRTRQENITELIPSHTYAVINPVPFIPAEIFPIQRHTSYDVAHRIHEFSRKHISQKPAYGSVLVDRFILFGGCAL